MAEQAVYDLFVSFAEADRGWVESYLLDALTTAGLRCHSEAAFVLGAPLLSEFERAVRQSARTLLILSPAYLLDDFSRFGDLLAQSFGLETATWPVIPLILHPVVLPPRLSILTPLDATDPTNWPEAIERLCQALQRPVPAAAPARPPCPYPGMVPFREEDRASFFGRDEEIRALLECLRLHPFLTVIGPSGSGKSSLVFAGLIPALRFKESGLFGDSVWRVCTFRPGASPVEAMRTALGENERDMLAPFAESPDQSRLLVVVDQFEEVFTVASEENAAIFQSALRRIIGTPNCFVVITFRADFYSELMASPLWPEIRGHRVEIVPLNETGLREAIVRPAEDVGVYVEAALVERLVTDAVGEPGLLPLVQETMVLLWERLERRFLSLRAYEALILPRQAYGGPPVSPRTGLHIAIARRADAALAQLPPDQQAIARRVFLRLVQFGVGRADTRRQQMVPDLRTAEDDPAAFEATVRHLADHRLLTLSGDECGERRADIAHEALIAAWPQLQAWLSERREAEQTRRRLEAKAEEWVRLGQSRGGLLDEAELPEAERWLEGVDATDLGYREELPALVQASRSAIEEAQRRAEAARQRELEQAQALAAAERGRAEDQARAARRLRRRLAFASIAAILAVAAAAAAFYGFDLARSERDGAQIERARAEREAQIARARALAGEAAVQLQLHNDELASLLALQAYRFNEGSEGEAWGQVDGALRATMGTPYFSHVLAQGAGVQSLAFDPRGKALVTGNRIGTAWIWDLSQLGREPTVLQGPGGWVTSMAFAPSGELLALGTDRGAVQVWTWSNAGSTPLNLQGPTKKITSLAFSGDSRLVAVAEGPSVYTWDLSDAANPTVVSPADARSVSDISVDAGGRLLLAGLGADQTLRVWDLQHPERSASLPGQEEWTATAAAFDADGQTLVAVGQDQTLRLWKLSEPIGVPTTLLAGSSASTLAAVGVEPGGQRVAAVANDGSLVIWSVDRPARPDVLRGHENIGIAVEFGPRGMLATGGGDAGRLWNVTEPSMRTVLLGHEDAVLSLAYSPDGGTLASASRDGTVRLWQPAQGDLPPQVLTNEGGWAKAVAFSPNGELLAWGSQDGSVRLWHRDASVENITVLPGNELVNALAFTPDGKRLAVGAVDGTVTIWDVESASVLQVFSFPGSNLLTVAVDPSGISVAAGGCTKSGEGSGVCDEGGVAIWSLQRLADPPLVLDRTDNAVQTVVYAASGRWLAAGSKDGAVLMWDVTSPGAGPSLSLDPGYPVATLAFSPTDAYLAAGHWNGTVTVWNLAHPAAPSVISLGGFVYALTYAPDGQTLAAGGSDGAIRLLASTEALADLVCGRVNRDLTTDEWLRFIGEAVPYEPTCPDASTEIAWNRDLSLQSSLDFAAFREARP